MRHVVILSVCMVLAIAGCETKSGDADSAQAVTVLGDINKTLEGVKDTDTAKAAAATLTELTSKVAPILEKVKSAAAAAAKQGAEGGKGLGEVGKAVVDQAKSALSGPLTDIMGKVGAQISRISQNSAMLEPLKGVLEKLQSLVKI